MLYFMHFDLIFLELGHMGIYCPTALLMKSISSRACQISQATFLCFYTTLLHILAINYQTHLFLSLLYWLLTGPLIYCLLLLLQHFRLFINMLTAMLYKCSLLCGEYTSLQILFVNLIVNIFIKAYRCDKSFKIMSLISHTTI